MKILQKLLNEARFAVVVVSHGSKKAQDELVSVLAELQSGEKVVLYFGPLGKENYSIGINKKATKQAIRQALSLKAKGDAIRVIEAFEVKDGKTASASKLLAKLGADRETLLVVENKDEAIMRATNNLSNVKVVQAMYLNTHDVINAHTVVITSKAVEIVENWLTKKEATK